MNNEIETLKKQLSDAREELKSAKNDVCVLLETVALLTKKNKELLKELSMKTFEIFFTADKDDENEIID